jgi:UDP:flavonoid glycosyltransferase YjiC (YdhE family)
VIHHGGIGSTAEALRAGRPQLVTPFGNDQFFNARRIASLGVGDTTSLYAQTPDALSQFLEERVLIPTVIRKARGFATQLKKEQGLTTSADLIEAELDGHASRL